MTELEAKTKILEIIEKAQKAIPKVYKKDLTVSESRPNALGWYRFENLLSYYGRQIHQLLNEHKKLRKDKYISNILLSIALNKNAKKGRQYFIIFFGYTEYSQYAGFLVKPIKDDFLRGHIINTQYDMRAKGFSDIIVNYKTLQNLINYA